MSWESSSAREHRLTHFHHVRTCTTCKARIVGALLLIALLAYWFFIR